MKEMGADLGIATDGDADRYGIVDRDGTFIQPITSLRCSSITCGDARLAERVAKSVRRPI